MIIREQLRAPIPARFLFAAPPPATTVIPEGFQITTVGEREAAGSKGRRWSGEAGPMSSRAHGAVYHGAKHRYHNTMR